MSLLHDLDAGKKRAITKEDYYHFFKVRPVAVLFTWNSERWDFGCGHGNIYAFKMEGTKYYAQKSDLVNPYSCGVSLKDQLQGKTPH